MTRQPAPYRIPRPRPPRGGPAAAPVRAGVLRVWRCELCGGADAHYLTCLTLRLPAGNRLGEDPGPERAGPRGEQRATCPGRLVPARRREGQPGGPDHPDWPRPPQR